MDDPAVPVWRFEEISQHVDSLWQTHRPMLNESEIEQINQVFQQVVENFEDAEREKDKKARKKKR